MDNSINFQGAFWLKKPSNSIQRRIKANLGYDYQIIKNLSSNGDILYITEKDADRKVAKVLANNRVKNFKYYPDINTKSGFSVNMPSEEAVKVLSNYKDGIVSSISKLKNIFKLGSISYKTIGRKKNTLEKCMQTLDLNTNDYNIVKQDGFSEIYTKDADKKLVAIISEPGQYGFRYAKIVPQQKGEEVKMYAVLPGEKFTYINTPNSKIEDATTDFLKNYIKSKKANQAVTHNAGHQ